MAAGSKSSGGAVAKPTAKVVPGLRVAAKVAGFRRGGRAWPADATDVPVADFSKAQLAQIRAEPMLVVTDIEIPAAQAAE